MVQTCLRAPEVAPEKPRTLNLEGKGNRAISDGPRNPFLYPLTLLEGEGARSGEEDWENRGWWLLHTRPRQEKKLAEELQTLGIGHYLPVTRLKAVTRGRPRYSWAPLFPGYCFLWANDDERVASLRTNRLVHTYSICDQPGLAQQLGQLAELIEMGVPLTIEDRLAVGQHVRVKSGLLKDLRGVVIRRSGKTRLYVYVTEMLGGVSVEIERHRLEPY